MFELGSVVQLNKLAAGDPRHIARESFRHLTTGEDQLGPFSSEASDHNRESVIQLVSYCDTKSQLVLRRWHICVSTHQPMVRAQAKRRDDARDDLARAPLDRDNDGMLRGAGRFQRLELARGQAPGPERLAPRAPSASAPPALRLMLSPPHAPP